MCLFLNQVRNLVTLTCLLKHRITVRPEIKKKNNRENCEVFITLEDNPYITKLWMNTY